MIIMATRRVCAFHHKILSDLLLVSPRLSPLPLWCYSLTRVRFFSLLYCSSTRTLDASHSLITLRPLTSLSPRRRRDNSRGRRNLSPMSPATPPPPRDGPARPPPPRPSLLPLSICRPWPLLPRVTRKDEALLCMRQNAKIPQAHFL